MAYRYRITLLEWDKNYPPYNDTIYADLEIDMPVFTNLKKAIDWVDSHREKLLKLATKQGHYAIDCDIEKWCGDYINGIVYSTNLWERKRK